MMRAENIVSYLRKISENNEAHDYDIYHYEIPRYAADLIEQQAATIERLSAPEVTDEMFAGALASFTMSEHRGNDRALALKRGADFINQALRRAGT
jgi:hypothetical protein